MPQDLQQETMDDKNKACEDLCAHVETKRKLAVMQGAMVVAQAPPVPLAAVEDHEGPADPTKIKVYRAQPFNRTSMSRT